MTVFPHVAVVRMGSSDFAWASDQPLDALVARAPKEFEQFVAENTDHQAQFGTMTMRLIDDIEVRRWVEGFEPINEADMQIVQRLSWRRLQRRFFDE